MYRTRPNGATSTQPGAERSGTPGIKHRHSAPCKGKSIKNIQYINCKHLIINAFALSGRVRTIVLFPGCRCALPRAVCLLPRRGASIQSAFILYPDDNVV